MCGIHFGERLNETTSVIHIEKAHIKFQGSYQAINQLFVKHCCGEIKYINREQDLGVQGLRRAKESYKPVFMVKKV
ncbi:MAG: phosphatidylglycerol lysyltransferase domain-containing protein [Promethearchaeia archaeon]